MDIFPIPREYHSPEEASALAPWDGATLLFRLTRRRFFEANQAIALVEDTDRLLQVRRAVWDSPNGTGEAPIHSFATSRISESNARALAKALAEIQLAPFTESEFGLDGASYSVAAHSHGGIVELSWWNNPPTTWADLADWFSRAWSTLESCLPNVPNNFNIGYRVR